MTNFVYSSSNMSECVRCGKVISPMEQREGLCRQCHIEVWDKQHGL